VQKKKDESRFSLNIILRDKECKRKRTRERVKERKNNKQSLECE
jgi:hypothetical protein